MAPSRGKAKAAARAVTTSPSHSTRSTRSQLVSDVPDVYRSMLDEAHQWDVRESADRPFKRRKLAERTDNTPEPLSGTKTGNHDSGSLTGVPSSSSRPLASNVQTVEESSEDEASDLEFEDVDLDHPMQHVPYPVDGIEDVSVTIQAESSSSKRPNQPRKKPATFAEKAHRLIIHKLHILCLLGHCMYVNGRCNNETVQKHLRPLLTTKTVSYLKPKADDTQFQRNRSFMDGLQQAIDAFASEFQVSSGGLIKPRWEIDGDTDRKHDFAPPVDRRDFIAAAKDLGGSQNTGNQLFGALLRAVGVNARIVCSLQVLHYTSMPKQSTPKMPIKTKVLAIAAETNSPREDGTTDEAVGQSSQGNGYVRAVRRRLGQPILAAEYSKAAPKKNKTKPVPKLTYPVFWVEAFNEAQQKWIAVDPVVTRTVNKPSQLEPPVSYELNQMTYVIALESDGTARDVTRRYAKAYNAKTRRHRVEASPEGGRWFKRVIRFFRRRGVTLDRDQVEDSELAQKEAKEGMPGNVQDFKDHPYYALERHLKRHEVIHPRREVGKVNAGTAAKPRMEPVYRAQDVSVCKSADKWYRLGREIKECEQPLKHVPARSKRPQSVGDDARDSNTALTGLYAPYQTQLYVPPPVQHGRIPKNIYGNLDIYVPSMIPAGAIHIRHELAQRAAKLLRVEYADAVTGFKFHGRHGTAILEGVVVAQQYGNAVRTVIEGLEDEITEEISKARSLAALRLWKRFTIALKIAERVSMYADSFTRELETDEGMVDNDSMTMDSLLRDDRDDNPLSSAGQYFLSELNTHSKPVRQKKRQKIDEAEDDEPQIEIEQADDFLHGDRFEESGLPGGFVPDDGGEGEYSHDEYGGGGFTHEGLAHDGDGFVQPDEHDGFLHENPDESGFIVGNAHSDDLFGEIDDHEALASSGDNEQGAAGEIDGSNSINPAEAMNVVNTNKGKDDFADGVSNRNRIVTPSEQQDESDKASILSHDPDDDDAEPDWLESD